MDALVRYLIESHTAWKRRAWWLVLIWALLYILLISGAALNTVTGCFPDSPVLHAEKPLYLVLFFLTAPNMIIPGLVEMLVSAFGIVIGLSALPFRIFEQKSLSVIKPDELHLRGKRFLYRFIGKWVWLGIFLLGLSELSTLANRDHLWDALPIRLVILILKMACLFLLSETAVYCFLKFRKPAAVLTLTILAVLIAGYAPDIVINTAFRIENLVNVGRLPRTLEYLCGHAITLIPIGSTGLLLACRYYLGRWNNQLIKTAAVWLVTTYRVKY